MIAALVVAAAAAQQTAPPARPVPGEALRRAVHFKGAQISPDAKRLAWVETVVGPEGQLANKGVIRVVDLEKAKAEPQRITAGKGKPADEGSLAWAPDGRRLAFLSDAPGDGQKQLFVPTLGAVAPAQLTPAHGGRP